MNYLVFDIECCDGRHICEFGYVLADAAFRVLERGVMTIAPEKPFDLGGEITLYFSEGEYNNSARFPVYYDRIRSLLEREDVLVVGHSVANDAAFLRTACRRYNLPPINFRFLDTQRLYRVVTEVGDVALERAGEALALPAPAHLHKSDDAALLTLQVLSALCARLGKSPPEVGEEYISVCGVSENHEISYHDRSLEELVRIVEAHPEQLGNKRRRACVSQYAEAWPPCAEPAPSPLAGKSLCFSAGFEQKETGLVMRLIRALAERGCRYHMLAAEIDYIVLTPEEASGEEPCPRLQCVRTAGRAEVLDYPTFYKMLGMSEEEVAATPLVLPKREKREKRRPRGVCYSTAESGGTTLGDLLRARGIDLSKFG